MSSISNTLKTAAYAKASSPVFQSVTISALDFEHTLARLKQAITEEQMWLIAEINPQMLLERAGYAIEPARQLLFFHPRYVVKLLASDPAALAEIPLKLVVMQNPDGVVSVRYGNVEGLLSRYQGVADLVQELASLSRRLVATVSGASA